MPAVKLKSNNRASGLDIAHPLAIPGAEKLRGLSVIVIGAGPAGLTFARIAGSQGANVIVLEQAAGPWGTNPGYTDRSFNITLDEVGRAVLGDERAWKGGTWLTGRALHDSSGNVRYGSYGKDSDAHLMSIPRPVLRQNLALLAMEQDANLFFNSTVTRVDPEAGKVWYTDEFGTELLRSADLVVFSDGLHSLGDGLAGSGSECSVRIEPRNCVMGILRPEDNHNLSTHHIHFWHEAAGGAYTIGLPNQDGSVALLLTSEFADISAGAHPFATPKAAAVRMQRDFPLLYALAPQLIHQLPAHRRGRFYYKQASAFVLGQRAVVVGDAGCVVPPWAGFGANNAMYGAASLAYQLIDHGGDLPIALAVYQWQQRVLSQLIMDYVGAQGEFLSGPVAKNPNGRSDSLEPLIRQARQIVQQLPEASLAGGALQPEPLFS